MSFAQQLLERIARDGAISVADYMEACNTHYYATRDPFGGTGDFITAPEISQIFGELVGAWLAECWLQLGSPEAVLCEAGPGRGTLMQDILRATARVPQFHARIRIRMIETSPVLQALQQRTLRSAHHDIAWQQNFTDLPSLPLLLVANEFFDALPIHHFLPDGSERTISLRNGTLCWTESALPVQETSPLSCNIMASIASHIRQQGGAALVIDYGYEHPPAERTIDTLQALRHHRYVDPLHSPGDADLTAHVNFGALAQAASGVQIWPVITQGDFLRRLGAELRATALCKQAPQEQRHKILSGLERLISPQAMGTLFKVLAITSSLEKPAGF